ncbi:nuclear transport factor 2 family protein [Natrarchaeobius oligotrophus]|nr:nuclear transport factor 2 family protein [Natrarchaeobius chitinivorans]
MSEEKRISRIEAYFDAMDAAHPELVEPALADGFVYESIADDLRGFDGLVTYMRELRGISNTDHEVSGVVHGEAASVVEGTVTGDGGGDSVTVDFCAVFEFDAADEEITRISVYARDE